MCKDAAKPKPIMPLLLIGLGGFALLVALYFWMTSDNKDIPTMEKPTPRPVVPAPVKTEVEQAKPTPPPAQEPIIEEEEVVEPAPVVVAPPVDTSDAAVKTSILATADYEAAASLLVDESLLQRFVVTAANLAEGEVAPNHQLLQPPSQNFRIYQQGGKEWIDPASYKRYTPYVDVIDTMSADTLVSLYETYQPTLNQLYAEIGDPSEPFNDVLKQAIEHLLETPSVPVPVEVYTDSVMYKYKDERLESLSMPQKHLIRMGPENMRRVKAKLREILEML
ncbi:DUF3014 domain-containing protein [Aestuariibacter sp. AA17]|uniref:DUF3014 domain-containing protein n=1 Tax=Fluctibacter corallii TaxID=2984329 RepID=A0ABT3AB27_9ALTE|nr:DUF3014 domain-containing protein [Aestuariibacter sp. AA17]MCV2885882.1 DUF3014 domain-containing protein [Aestuariibacter sp. AA17]